MCRDKPREVSGNSQPFAPLSLLSSSRLQTVRRRLQHTPEGGCLRLGSCLWPRKGRGWPFDHLVCAPGEPTLTWQSATCIATVRAFVSVGAQALRQGERRDRPRIGCHTFRRLEQEKSRRRRALLP